MPCDTPFRENGELGKKRVKFCNKRGDLLSRMIQACKRKPKSKEIKVEENSVFKIKSKTKNFLSIIRVAPVLNYSWVIWFNLHKPLAISPIINCTSADRLHSPWRNNLDDSFHIAESYLVSIIGGGHLVRVRVRNG